MALPTLFGDLCNVRNAFVDPTAQKHACSVTLVNNKYVIFPDSIRVHSLHTRRIHRLHGDMTKSGAKKRVQTPHRRKHHLRRERYLADYERKFESAHGRVLVPIGGWKFV